MKENHIGSAVSEILQYRQKNQLYIIGYIFYLGQENWPPAPEGREEQLRPDWAGAVEGGGGDQVHVQRRTDPERQ